MRQGKKKLFLLYPLPIEFIYSLEKKMNLKENLCWLQSAINLKLNPYWQAEVKTIYNLGRNRI